jgi:chemotaxis protein MotA
LCRHSSFRSTSRSQRSSCACSIKYFQSVGVEGCDGLIIADFIKKACNQYRNDESIGETLHVIGAQISNSKAEAESRLEVTRYVISAISALGFIGTVMGLADSIGLAHLASDPEKIKMITGSLYVAFDTTLVALLLSLVLTYRYHVYLEMLDSFYSQSEAYIIENLVSRIKKDA